LHIFCFEFHNHTLHGGEAHRCSTLQSAKCVENDLWVSVDAMKKLQKCYRKNWIKSQRVEEECRRKIFCEWEGKAGDLKEILILKFGFTNFNLMMFLRHFIK
jgi:hypothetical protein